MRENYILYQSYQGPPPQQLGENVFADKWIYPWSEPVRFRVIHESLIASGGTLNPDQPFPPATWFAELNQPVQLPRRLHAALNPFMGPFVIQPPGSATLIQGWFMELAEPVWPKPGLGARYQQSFAYHPRLLPTPTVTATMSAVEINSDDATFGVNITSGSTVSGQYRALVTITEIQAQNSAGVSIRE